jgi:hypothetical protein
MLNKFEVYAFYNTLRVIETPIEVSSSFLKELNEFNDDIKTLEYDVELKPGVIYNIIDGEFEGKQLIYHKKIIYILEDELDSYDDATFT